MLIVFDIAEKNTKLFIFYIDIVINVMHLIYKL